MFLLCLRRCNIQTMFESSCSIYGVFFWRSKESKILGGFGSLQTRVWCAFKHYYIIFILISTIVLINFIDYLEGYAILRSFLLFLLKWLCLWHINWDLWINILFIDRKMNVWDHTLCIWIKLFSIILWLTVLFTLQ